MAHLKTDIYINNENSGQSVLPPSKNVLGSARKHTAKKQAFGEIKNVIHNQNQPKFLKANEGPSKSCTDNGRLFRNVLQTQNKKPQSGTVLKPKPTKALNVPVNPEEEEIELLNYLDIDRKCCRQPYKSDRQVWSDMNMFDDSLLDKIITGCRLRDDDESVEVERFDLDKSDSEDILDFNNPKHFPAAGMLDDSSDDDAAVTIKLEHYDFL